MLFHASAAATATATVTVVATGLVVMTQDILFDMLVLLENLHDAIN